MKRNTHIVLRPLAETDGPALAGLTFSVDDAGLIRYTANYQIDAIRAVQAINGAAEGLVACLGAGGRLVALELVRYGSCWYEGAQRPFAQLGNLIVHPQFRRQGIGTQVNTALVEAARARLAELSLAYPNRPAGVVTTNFQDGNPIVNRLLDRIPASRVGPVLYRPLPMLTKPPDPLPGITAGPLEDAEVDAFTYAFNTFYNGYNFAQLTTPEDLRALLRRDIFPASGGRPAGPIRHAYAAFDSRGRQVAGLVAFEQYRVRQLEIRGLPGMLQVMNMLMPVVPIDGATREMYLDRLWFRDEHHAALRHLVDTVRWIWNGSANNVSVFLDPRSPVGKLFPARPWDIAARTMVGVATQPDLPPVDPGRLLSPIY